MTGEPAVQRREVASAWARDAIVLSETGVLEPDDEEYEELLRLAARD
ncbi:MAG: hypothetical protein ACI8UR_001283 [Natronomonas sp.]|jgi:hypothetical protein